MTRARWKQCLFGLAMAGAVAQTHAAGCVAGSLGSYLALGAGGCTVGSLTFADFALEAFPGPTAQQIAPGSLSIAPIAGGFALSSDAGLFADAGTLLGLRLLFDVQAPGLVGGTVAFGPNRSATGDGVLTALLDAGAAGNSIALVIDGFEDTPVSFASAATGSYVAFLELGVDGGTQGSASLGPALASVTFAATTVSPVPEPESFALLIPGLLVILARRRKTIRG